MSVSIDDRWQGFVDAAVKSGRYGSASEGLRLVEKREAKLSSLRETLNASIAQGGEHSADDVQVHLASEAGT